MGKRSPILGYNHNVRYRGLVFHVQTEDSGVASPHLFTHLFHGGVIVSSRKLVYDAGSAEESIKSLMQAQHKATLKDLRRGHFDDKIDSYLGGTPGLLPRGTEDPGVADPAAGASEPEPAVSPGTVEELAVGAPTEQVLPIVTDELSEPVMLVERVPPPRPLIPPPPLPRAVTERPLPPKIGRGTSPSVDTTLKTEMLVYAEGDATQAVEVPTLDTSGSSFELDDVHELDAPEIEIQLELDDNDEAMPPPPPPSRRNTRDTELQSAFDHTRPTLEVPFDDHTRPTLGTVNEEARRASSISDGIPGAIRASSPAIPPPPPADSRRLGDRPSTINAATLPPGRPIARPPTRPALSQPQVVARPVTASDDRGRRESEPVEVYSPAPASAELPGERPGQYAQHRKSSNRIPVEGLKNERSGGIAIPAGLGRPHRSTTMAPPAPRPASTPPPSVAAAPPPSASSMASASASSMAAMPAAASHESSRNGGHAEPVRARAPTPARISPSGPASAPRAASASSGNGVVMTRPAVIVGAPAKSVATVPRIRKAREEEGRGFGQGLISEKSLDEVILAYLSEDADEK